MTTLWDRNRRIVFQRGVTWVKDGNGRWNCRGTDGDVGEVSAIHMTKVLDLQPVLIELDEPGTGLGPTFLMACGRNGTLDSVQTFYSADFKNPIIRLNRDVFPTLYNASALIYHCKQMVESYVRGITQFTRQQRGNEEHGHVRYFWQTEPFFEFDALVTACIRTLDALRRPIWALYGNPGSLPSSFSRVLEACQPKMPPQMYESLTAMKSQWFEIAKEYRDCIQHYFAPGSSRSIAIMERKEPGIWSMSAWLPDEPARSLNEFTFKQQVDALDYGWQLSTHVVGVCEIILGAGKAEATE